MLGAVVAMALGACGDDADDGDTPSRAPSVDQREIEIVIRKQSAALERGDLEAYCHLMTSRLANRQAEYVPGKTCAERLRKLLPESAAQASPDLYRVKIDGVRVGIGSRPYRARAFVRVARGQQTLYFLKRDGEWKLDRRFPSNG